MKKVVVYSINNCPYCDAAKKLLNQRGLSFNEYNISNNDAERIALVQKTGHKTLPQIFIDDEFIGGYAELKLFLNK